MKKKWVILASLAAFCVLVIFTDQWWMQFIIKPDLPNFVRDADFFEQKNTTPTPITVSNVNSDASEKEVTVPDQIATSATTSTSSKVGSFVVEITCIGTDPSMITITQAYKLTQQLKVRTSDDGVRSCPAALSQDVNFDGYKDFLLLTDTGTGGARMSYWQYNPKTGQFYCPKANKDCNLLNPVFDEKTHTITSRYSLGAANIVTDIYNIVDGQLNLYRSTKTGN